MSDDCDDTYEVGYGKPPKEHQFKKKQSGNPKGRPKNPKRKVYIADALERALAKRIEVNVNGRRQKMTAEKAMVWQLVKRGLEGDSKIALGILDRNKRTARDRRAQVSEVLAMLTTALKEGPLDAPTRQSFIDVAVATGDVKLIQEVTRTVALNSVQEEHGALERLREAVMAVRAANEQQEKLGIAQPSSGGLGTLPGDADED